MLAAGDTEVTKVEVVPVLVELVAQNGSRQGNGQMPPVWKSGVVGVSENPLMWSQGSLGTGGREGRLGRPEPRGLWPGQNLNEAGWVPPV